MRSIATLRKLLLACTWHFLTGTLVSIRGEAISTIVILWALTTLTMQRQADVEGEADV